MALDDRGLEAIILRDPVGIALIDPNMRLGDVETELPLILRGHPPVASLAAFLGSFDVFRDREPDLSQCDDFGRSIAHFACAGGSVDSCLELIKAGVSFATRDGAGKRPGDYAAEMNHCHLLEMLVEQGLLEESLEEWRDGGPEPEVMRIVAGFGHEKVVQFLIGEGVPLCRDGDDLTGTTAMHRAAEGGHEGVLRILIANGGCVLKSNSKGVVPLVCAVECGSLACVKLLLDHGASIDGAGGAFELIRRARKAGYRAVLHELEDRTGLAGSWTDGRGRVRPLHSELSGTVRVPLAAKAVVLPRTVEYIDLQLFIELARLEHLTVHTHVKRIAVCEFVQHWLQSVEIEEPFAPTMTTISALCGFAIWMHKRKIPLTASAQVRVDIRIAQLLEHKPKDFAKSLLWLDDTMVDGDRDEVIYTYTGNQMVEALLHSIDTAIYLVLHSAKNDEPNRDDEPVHRAPRRDAEDGSGPMIDEPRRAIMADDLEWLANAPMPRDAHRVIEAMVKRAAEPVVRTLVGKFPELRGCACEAVARYGELTHLLREFPTEARESAVFMSALLGGNERGLKTLIEMGIHPPRRWDIAACFADNYRAFQLLKVAPRRFTHLILKLDAQRCARLAGLSPDALLVEAVDCRSIRIMTTWIADGKVAAGPVIDAAIDLGRESVASFAVAAGAIVTAEMIAKCIDEELQQFLIGVLHMQESPPLTDKPQIPLRVAETERRDLIDPVWAPEGRRVLIPPYRDDVETGALAGGLCLCDEFSILRHSFMLFVEQNGDAHLHWLRKRVTKRKLEETILGFTAKVRVKGSRVSVMVRDNRIDYDPDFLRVMEDVGVRLLPLPRNANDAAGGIEALIEAMIEHADLSDVLGLVASFISERKFGYLFDGITKIPAVVSFSAGESTLTIFRDGKLPADFRFTPRASRPLTAKQERDVHLLVDLGVPQVRAAEFVGLRWQTVRAMVSLNKCRPGRSIAVNLDNAKLLSIIKTIDGPAICYTDKRGHIDIIDAGALEPWQKLAVAGVEYLVQRGFRGKIIGQCGDNVVVAIGPAVGTFVFEIPKTDVPMALPRNLPHMREKSVRRIVRINNGEGSVTAGANFFAELFFDGDTMPDDWTEAIVTAEGNTPKFDLEGDVATFTPTGPPAKLRLDHPSRAGIANLSGGDPGTHDFREVGGSHLLDLQGGRGVTELVAVGECEMTPIELRSIAIQFQRAWPGQPRLRQVAITMFEHGAIGLEWPGFTEFAADAGVCYNTVAKHIDRALAVGLPLPGGLDDPYPFAWMGVRRECVLALLREGLFTKWPALIEHVDARSAAIEDPDERERFLYVGQAVVSLRLREKGECHVPVRAELNAEGVELKFSNQELDQIIASVQDGLPKL